MPDSPAISTERGKALDAARAMHELQQSNPTLRGQINDEFFNSGMRYTPKLRSLVASVSNASIRHRLDAFFSDTKAYPFLFDQFAADLQKAFNGTLGPAASIVGNLPQDTLGGVAAGLHNTFTNPLSALFQANIWIRVGEVALGLVLIAVGVARLTNAVPIATKIARKIP